MGSFCGEWIRVGQTTTITSTYAPCPPDLADANYPLVPPVAPSHTQLSSRVLRSGFLNFKLSMVA